ncbi:MAG: hypothetical protein QXY61_00230 [Candidatus Anstonellales archaeon]
MNNKIKFPEIKKNAELRFVRRYRQKGVTRYIFYRANINTEVSQVLKEWLSKEISKISDRELTDYTVDNFQDVEYINLKTIDTWGEFEQKAFTLEHQENEILEKIKNHLIAFIIYVKQDDEIIGYVRKITPKSLLNKKGWYVIFLKDSSFNEIKKQEGVEIDDLADLVFKISKNKSEGAILQKYNFNSIFDIFEQQKNDSIKILEMSDLITKHPEKAEIENMVKSDRQIQQMLLNPLFKSHAKEVDFATLKKLKEEVGDKIHFELDETNKIPIFPADKRREAIKDFIKVISYRYQRDLDSKHILESKPIKMIK